MKRSAGEGTGPMGDMTRGGSPHPVSKTPSLGGGLIAYLVVYKQLMAFYLGAHHLAHGLLK